MVRPNELSFARRGALNKLAARSQGARPSQLTAVLVGVDPEDDSRAIVSFDGSEVSVLAGPVKMIPGALCAVEVDAANAPVRVLGPVTTRPEGLDEDVPTPDAVMPMPELGPRELTEADAQAIQDTVDGLAVAQADLQDAFERIGNIATEVGFAWSGSFEADYPVGSNFRVDWVALGGGEFRYTMVNIPPGANFGWSFTLPQDEQVFPTTNPAIVTATEAGLLTVYAWADDETHVVDTQQIEVHPAMLDATGPLQAAIAEASAAAVRASRIAPRSLREPTVEDGDNRPTGAVWTLVNAAGEELAYWAWTGTAWIPQALSRQVIPYLDAAHISTGVLDADRINVTEIWGQIATFGKIITQDLIATGAVTSRHMNVVPEEGTGGVEILPPGIRIIPPDAEAGTAISFRSDEDSWIAFAQGGESTFSVSPAGDLTAQTVAANESLTYRGEELTTVLGRLNQGVVSSSVSRLMQPIRMDGSERTILKVNVPARDPALGSRNLVVRFQIVTDRAEAPLGLRIRQTQDGSNVSVSSSLYQEFTAQARNGVITASIPAQVAAGVEWNVLISGWSGAGCNLEPGGITHAYVEDLGNAVPWDNQTPPGAPASGGGSETTPTPAPTKLVTKTFSPTWTRSFLGNGSFYNYGAGRAYHGQYLAGNGILGSAVGFNRTNIASHVASGEIVKVEVFLKNSHTYSSAGMSAQWGTHGHTSAPSSYSVPTGGYTDSFKPGQGKWVTLPESDWSYWKTGGSNGIRFKPSSTSSMSYGYFDGAATRVRITVRK